MNIKKIKDIVDIYKYTKLSIESKQYMESRYTELVHKGFSNKQALQMVSFELSFSRITQNIVSEASAGACFSATAIPTFETVLPFAPNAAVPTALAVGGSAA